MTACAFPPEIRFAGRRVADEHVEGCGINRTWGTRLSAYLGENAVDVLRDGGDIGVAEVEAGHAFVLARAVDDRADFLAVLVAQSGQGAEQAGAALIAAAKVGAVAGGAIDAVDGLAAGKHFGGRQRTSLLRKVWPAASGGLSRGAAAAPACRWRWLILTGLLRKEQAGSSQ